jgi:hypothetical protein
VGGDLTAACSIKSIKLTDTDLLNAFKEAHGRDISIASLLPPMGFSVEFPDSLPELYDFISILADFCTEPQKTSPKWIYQNRRHNREGVCVGYQWEGESQSIEQILSYWIMAASNVIPEISIYDIRPISKLGLADLEEFRSIQIVRGKLQVDDSERRAAFDRLAKSIAFAMSGQKTNDLYYAIVYSMDRTARVALKKLFERTRRDYRDPRFIRARPITKTDVENMLVPVFYQTVGEGYQVHTFRLDRQWIKSLSRLNVDFLKLDTDNQLRQINKIGRASLIPNDLPIAIYRQWLRSQLTRNLREWVLSELGDEYEECQRTKTAIPGDLRRWAKEQGTARRDLALGWFRQGQRSPVRRAKTMEPEGHRSVDDLESFYPPGGAGGHSTSHKDQVDRATWTYSNTTNYHDRLEDGYLLPEDTGIDETVIGQNIPSGAVLRAIALPGRLEEHYSDSTCILDPENRLPL